LLYSASDVRCESGDDDDADEVPVSLLQTYELGKVLYKMDAVTVKRCEYRYARVAQWLSG